ncbi:MAG: hypothetical protein KGM98_09165 [Bacteroidota bacterium]|nr:hypothetical protein [Bacteroidota bacterium]
MKKILCLFCIGLITCQSYGQSSQSVPEYVLVPASATLQPGESVKLQVKKLDSATNLPLGPNDLNIGSETTPYWYLNGSVSAPPTDGKLAPDLSFLNAKYIAPGTAPRKNPVAVSVQFHPPDNPKSLLTLVCNIRIVTASYKVTLHGEITGPKGIHFLVNGVSYRNLHSYADGTYALLSYDGSKNMHLTVSAAGVPGKMWLVSPLEYDIPVVINIGNIKKGPAPAKVSIESFSPTQMGGYTAEDYWTPGGIMNFPGYISHTFTPVFYQIAVNSAKETKNQAVADMGFLQRLKAHEGDAAYLRSAQGRADLQKMQQYMEAHGRGDLFSHMQHPSSKPSAYSEAFVKGMQGTQTHPGSYGPPPGMNTPNVMNGLLHLPGTFNPKSGNSMTIFEEASPGGGLQGTLIVKVQKLH